MKEQSIYPISESQVLEPLGFNRLQPATLRPRREVELSPTRSDPHLVTLHDIDPEAAAQYNRLAIGLISRAVKHPPLKRVLVVSAHHCEGRTCVLLNLGIALARARQRVLVVDADLMRPSVNRLLGIDTEIGLSEALTAALPPEAAVTRLLPVSIDVLPARAQIENPAQVLASPEFKTMLAALDGSYDFMLFDSPPLLSSADASLLELYTHVTMMVVRPGTTTVTQMAKAVSLLNEESLFGVILNRVVSD